MDRGKLIERLRDAASARKVQDAEGYVVGLLTEAADALSRPVEAVAGEGREGVQADCGAIAKPTEPPPRPTREEVARIIEEQASISGAAIVVTNGERANVSLLWDLEKAADSIHSLFSGGGA